MLSLIHISQQRSVPNATQQTYGEAITILAEHIGMAIAIEVGHRQRSDCRHRMMNRCPQPDGTDHMFRAAAKRSAQPHHAER